MLVSDIASERKNNEKLEQIDKMNFDYVDNEDFGKENIEAVLFSEENDIPFYNFSLDKKEKGLDKKGVNKLSSDSVLSVEQESILFKQYNYCKKKILEIKNNNPTKELFLWYDRFLNVKSKIVNYNMKLVSILVGKYYSRVDKDDLKSDAQYALLMAIEKFDTSCGKFSTYAYWSIINAFGKLHKENSRRKEVMPISISHESEEFQYCSGSYKEDQNNIMNIEALNVVLDKNLANLTEKELKIIHDRYLEPKKVTIAEIKNQSGDSYYLINKWEKSALKKIKKALESSRKSF